MESKIKQERNEAMALSIPISPKPCTRRREDGKKIKHKKTQKPNTFNGKEPIGPNTRKHKNITHIKIFREQEIVYNNVQKEVPLPVATYSLGEVPKLQQLAGEMYFVYETMSEKAWKNLKEKLKKCAQNLQLAKENNLFFASRVNNKVQLIIVRNAPTEFLAEIPKVA